MIELLLLDVRTLAFASSVSGFLMAATMVGIYLAGMRSHAIVDWTIAGLGFGSGYLLGHILQTLEVPIPIWAAASLANALIALGHGMVLVGVQRYLGRPTWFWSVMIVVVALFFSVFFVTELRESLRWRVIVQSGFYVVFGALAGGLLWRARRPGMGRFHRSAAVVILVFAGLLFLRFVYALFSPALTTSFVSDPFQIGIFIISMVYGYALTMALVLVLFREKQVELANLAERDALTGLYNRFSLDTIAQREMQRAILRQADLSLILIDLDHFKVVNDHFGHQAGDRALRRIAELIDEMIRDTDCAFRYGGEEFLLLLPSADLEQARQVAERLRERLSACDFRIDGEPVDLRASFGVVTCRPENMSWNDCVAAADRALYLAKDGGRDRVVTVPDAGSG